MMHGQKNIKPLNLFCPFQRLPHWRKQWMYFQQIGCFLTEI